MKTTCEDKMWEKESTTARMQKSWRISYPVRSLLRIAAARIRTGISRRKLALKASAIPDYATAASFGVGTALIFKSCTFQHFLYLSIELKEKMET